MIPDTPPVDVRAAKFGQGVFANRQILRRQIVGEVLGQVIADLNYSSNYCMDMGNGSQIEPSYPFRFMNHCCEPNCELIYYEPHAVTAAQEHLLDRLFVRALKKINRGEELLIDYAWPKEIAIRCGCGSKKCRGWIVRPEEVRQMQNGKANAKCRISNAE